MDRGAWWATVHSLAKSQTLLSNEACMHKPLSVRDSCRGKAKLQTDESVRKPRPEAFPPSPARRLGSLPPLKSQTSQGGWPSMLPPRPCQRDGSNTQGLAHTWRVPTAAPRRPALGAGPFPKHAVGWITHGKPALPGAFQLHGPLFPCSHMVSQRQREAETRRGPSEMP